MQLSTRGKQEIIERMEQYTDFSREQILEIIKQLETIDLLDFLAETELDKQYSEGYDDGYDEGLHEGSESEYDRGYDAGYNEGYDEGHRDGFSEGYDKGVEES